MSKSVTHAVTQKPHLVFVHGLNCSSTIFNHLHSQLPEHTATFIDYDSKGSIERSYEQVKSKLPREPHIIIGHSLGGILGYLLSSRGPANDSGTTKGLITISTPFGGSELAVVLQYLFPWFRLLKDISIYSAIVRELKTSVPSCPFLSIVSTSGNLPFFPFENDGVVTIKSQKAVLADKRVEVGVNHFESVQSKDTIEEITKFLSRESQ